MPGKNRARQFEWARQRGQTGEVAQRERTRPFSGYHSVRAVAKHSLTSEKPSNLLEMCNQSLAGMRPGANSTSNDRKEPIASSTNRMLSEALECRVQMASGTRLQQMLRDPRKLLPILTRYLIALALQRSFASRGRTFWGDQMNVVIPDVSWYLLAYGYFEEGLTSIALKYVGENQVFFDIGSHVGYYTLLAHRLVGEGGQVHSFEPTPRTYTILRSNVAGRRNIFTNDCAVFSENTDLQLYDYGPTHSAFNSLTRGRLGVGVFRVPVPTEIGVRATSIDKYVESIGVVPDFVKIDAESSELEALRGMTRTLASSRPVVTAEVGDIGVPGVPSSSETVAFMLDLGYQPHEYRKGRIIPHQPREAYVHDNILFLPDELCKSLPAPMDTS